MDKQSLSGKLLDKAEQLKASERGKVEHSSRFIKCQQQAPCLVLKQMVD